jgi:hypothetical protein
VCCLVSDKSKGKGSVSHDPIGEFNGGGFGVSIAMLDKSDVVGDEGISIVRPAIPAKVSNAGY